MASQRGFLGLSRGVHVMKIEAAFSDRNHFFRLGKLPKCGDSIGIAILRIVRVNPNRGVNMRMPLRDFDGAPIRLDRRYRADRDDRADSRIVGALKNLVEVAVQLRIGEMAVGIYDRVHELINDMSFL